MTSSVHHRRTAAWRGPSVVTALLVVTGSIGTGPALATVDICVGSRHGCVPTLQAALDQARSGSLIRLDRGVFRGGGTVRRSVTIEGAGQRTTVLRGGGPVLTIGQLGDSTPPTVHIRNLTIRGGRTTSSDVSRSISHQEGVWALGGGVEIPPGATGSDEVPGQGATVTMSHTTVQDNRVAPRATLASPSGVRCPNGKDCPFAIAAGGGIDSWGDLTVVDSRIRRNRVGTASGISALASDVEGGGIRSWIGPLTLRNTRIEGNLAAGTGPNGRFAEGGGIFHGGAFFPGGDALVVRHSRVTHNTARLQASLPDSAGGSPIDQVAIGGGMQITEGVPSVTITDSVVSGNGVRMTNTVGSATAFVAG